MPERPETEVRSRAAGIRRLMRALAVTIVGAVALGFGVTAAGAATADDCANPVACENALPGTDPWIWDIDGAGDDSIQGYSTDISVNVGGHLDFKIDTDASAYTIDIYRTGWYQGLGARKITSVPVTATLPQHQPECRSDIETELFDCGDWGVSAGWDVPASAVSGVYFALLTRTDTGGQSHIVFVVRDDDSGSDVLFQTSDPTWQAYNTYGGSDFYQGAANGRAYKISYNRPIVTRGNTDGRDFYFSAEYAQVRFLERNGYDVSYTSGVDTDRRGAELLEHEVFLTVGHDEYWSAAQRANIEAARDAGVNIQFLSGNDGYWHTRYEPASSEDATPYRTLVSYKETWSYDKIDPLPEWTGTWRDPRYAPPSAGANQPENALIGTLYMSNFSDLPITVSADEGKTRLWRNTSLSALPAGASEPLAEHTIGYESNEDLDNGARPPGLIRLSTTTGEVPEYLQDYGNVVLPGETTHHLTLYRAASDALVFSAGSVQWAWGLDAEHDGDGAPADPRMQQAQINLLADMGAQPATLQPELVAATPSTDTVPPTVAITSPGPGSQVVNGDVVELTGTAADVGGVVAGVEVSTDAGATWHAAAGTTSWSYEFVAHGMGVTQILVRAIDDSANFPAEATPFSLDIQGPYTIFGPEVPATPDAGDATPGEIGIRFTTTVDGYISGVRFYKSEQNTGTHTGSLWDAAGERVATGTFVDETASGWQELRFDRAVPVLAGSVYTASYYAPAGHYAAEEHGFDLGGISRDPFVVVGGFGAEPAGVFNSAGDFPTDAYHHSKYYVDAIFSTTDSSPLGASSQWPLPGSSSVPLDTTISAVFSKPLVDVDVSVTDALGAQIAGEVAYDATTRTATFTPAAPLDGFVEYTVTLTATAVGGTPLGSGASWTFRSMRPDPAAGVCPCRLFSDGTTPSILEVSDPDPVTLGVRFTPSSDGLVRGVSFYKGAGNTGTHTGSLWRADGEELASGTFTEETTSGWQTLVFDEPVEVTAGTEYLASYRTSVGRYSATLGAFAGTGLTNGPLSAPENAGAFTYGAGFPGEPSTTNYLVDVVYEKTTQPFTLLQTTPADDAIGIPRDTTISATFSSAVADGAELTVTSGGDPVAGDVSLSSDRRVITFDPSADLPGGAVVHVALRGLAGQEGGTAPDRLWSFTTFDDSVPATSVTLFGDQVPEVPAATDDGGSVELGVAFSSTEPGIVTGIRFYKGEGNTGTHVGSLWDDTGTRIAQATFAGETATGWQLATFGTPVAIEPGREYVASYLAPNGHYANTAEVFGQPVTSGPLTAPAETNGRFHYGSGGVAPEFSWQRTNYFVDVVFRSTGPAAPAPVGVSSSSPADGATGVDLAATVSAVLTGVPAAETPTVSVAGPGGDVAGASTWDPASGTISFDPDTPLDGSTTYTAAVDVGGSAPDGGTWSFTTRVDAAALSSFFPSAAVPENTSWDDAEGVQLGFRFTTSAETQVAGIRFYKVEGDADTHLVRLWGASQSVPLASVTTSGESASGWQTVLFPEPVAIAPGTEYRASYYTSRGRYAADDGGLAEAQTVGPISSVANGGVYVYSADYPGGTSGANYWADILFAE